MSNVTPFKPVAEGGPEAAAANRPSAATDSPPATERPLTPPGTPSVTEPGPPLSRAERLAAEVMSTLGLEYYMPMTQVDRRREAVTNAIGESAPADEIEGMLMTQMLAAHSRGMRMLYKSITADYIDERLRCHYILAAVRMLSLFRRQLKALNRLRDWSDKRERRAKDGRRKPRKPMEPAP